MQIPRGNVGLAEGVIPNRYDAFRFINAVKGIFIREEIHKPGGVSSHTYWHMHYAYRNYENTI